MAPSRPKTVYMVRSVTGGKSIVLFTFEQKDGTLSQHYLSRNYGILRQINPKVHTFLRSFQVKNYLNFWNFSGTVTGCDLLLDLGEFEKVDCFEADLCPPRNCGQTPICEQCIGEKCVRMGRVSKCPKTVKSSADAYIAKFARFSSFAS